MRIKPKLARQITVADFKSHYWLKAQLLGFCKANALSMAGSKQEIIERIDFFANEKGKSQLDVVKAWKAVKTFSGAKLMLTIDQH